jgi:hypothetical protein
VTDQLKRRLQALLERRGQRTGDQEYIAAAACLGRLLTRQEILTKMSKPEMGRTRVVSEERLARIAWHHEHNPRLTAHAAVKHEVAAHGRGEHTSEAAAIDRLRRAYRPRARHLRSIVRSMVRSARTLQTFHNELERSVQAQRACLRGTNELVRSLNAQAVRQGSVRQILRVVRKSWVKVVADINLFINR